MCSSSSHAPAPSGLSSSSRSRTRDFQPRLWQLLTLHFHSRYSPVLLARRAKKMRAETGDLSIMTEQELHRRPLSEILVEALVRPLGSFTFTLEASMFTNVCLQSCFSVSRPPGGARLDPLVTMPACSGTDHDMLFGVPMPHLRAPVRIFLRVPHRLRCPRLLVRPVGPVFRERVSLSRPLIPR